jgi:RNA polymerase sigma-70 factor (ECF subfamily)
LLVINLVKANLSSISFEELIRACTEIGTPEAWEEFVHRLQPTIAMVALRIARQWGQSSPDVVDDLIQETYLKLCADRGKVLREFEQRHPDALFGFIKVVTANIVRDHFKAQHTEKRGAGKEPDELDEKVNTVAEGGGTGSPESIEQEILLKEIDDCLVRHLEQPSLERDRMVFWFYFRHGMTAQAISTLPAIGLSTKGVESVILRLTRLVRSELAEARFKKEAEAKQAKKKGFLPAESL